MLTSLQERTRETKLVTRKQDVIDWLFTYTTHFIRANNIHCTVHKLVIFSTTGYGKEVRTPT